MVSEGGASPIRRHTERSPVSDAVASVTTTTWNRRSAGRPDRPCRCSRRGPVTREPSVGDVEVARSRAVLEVAAAWYRERLVVDRPGVVVELLARRGLADLGADTALGLRWRVGYAPPGAAAAGVLTALGGRGFTDAELVAAGVAGPGRSGGGVVPVLRGRLVVPLADAGGVVGFTARRICDADAWVPKWVNRRRPRCTARGSTCWAGPAERGSRGGAGVGGAGRGGAGRGRGRRGRPRRPGGRGDPAHRVPRHPAPPGGGAVLRVGAGRV